MVVESLFPICILDSSDKINSANSSNWLDMVGVEAIIEDTAACTKALNSRKALLEAFSAIQTLSSFAKLRCRGPRRLRNEGLHKCRQVSLPFREIPDNG